MKKTKSLETYNFTVLFEPTDEGGYVATCPVLPGCITQGENLEEARAMAREAILGYIEVLKKDGLPYRRTSKALARPRMSSRLPALTPRQVLRALQRAGFFVHHVRGSHIT